MTSLEILYEDDALIFVNKPAGLPSQPTVDENRENIFSMTKKWLLENKNHEYLGMHHRLDRDTSGVLLFTKKQSVNFDIGEQFKNHTCTKTYAAIVHGKLKKKSDRIESYQAEIGKRNNQKRYGSVKSGGKKAITHYQVLKAGRWHTLLQINIETGRTHQIRVHLSEQGNPVVGDTLYGSPLAEYKKYKRFLLHAMQLEITHPESKKKLCIKSPIPEIFEVEEGLIV